jgi:aspartyl/asparaginyl-tRNA synthetase
VGTGASVEVSGQLVRSQGKGQSVEVLAQQVKLVGNADVV